MSHFHITLNLILGSEVIKVVISVNNYKQIRQRYLNGESQRSIAKSIGISRNTVKKYCEGENVPWERKTPEREASVLTEDVLAFITSCLEEDEAEGLKKQRHTARRIFDRLVVKYVGYEVSIKGYHNIQNHADPNSTFGELLLELMRTEYEQRQENNNRRRLKQANFPFTKTIDELDLSRYHRIIRSKR